MDGKLNRLNSVLSEITSKQILGTLYAMSFVHFTTLRRSQVAEILDCVPDAVVSFAGDLSGEVGTVSVVFFRVESMTQAKHWLG